MMQTNDIKQIFDRKFKGQKNFMTPNIVRYGKKGQYLYELSKGSGIDGGTIYGVTFLTLEGERPEERISEGGLTKYQAENLIQAVGK
jgi:hypothetical protein